MISTRYTHTVAKHDVEVYLSVARNRRRNRLIVPEAREGITAMQAEVLRREGYTVDPNRPHQAKYEVASEIGVPLQPGYNGNIKAEEAGKVGGVIGGLTVRELVRLAQQQLSQKQ